MILNTKYNINDRVEFIRDNKSPEVGIIDKIMFNGKHISYLLKSSYQDWVKEDQIQFILEAKDE